MPSAVTPVGKPRKFTFDGTCFNCDKSGHKVADCPHPKCPRQERRKQWKKQGVPAAVSDIKTLVSEAEMTGSNQQLIQYVDVFVYHVEELTSDEIPLDELQTLNPYFLI